MTEPKITTHQPRLLRALRLLRSPAELRTRGGQRIAAWLERVSRSPSVREVDDVRFAAALAAGVASDPDSLLQRIVAEPSRAPFAAFDTPSSSAARARADFPEMVDRVIERARRATQDHFDLLGHERLSYGRPIDWQRDPLSGRRAPLVHWSDVPYLDAERVGDHKVIWEVNRHQHLITLAQAYWLTRDAAFAGAVARHMSEWMDANPPKRGINWSSSLEVAFRAISWCWAIQMLRSSGQLDAPFVTRVIKFLNIHANHIETHLSTYFSPNTHLTGEALGLLYVGTCFPFLRRAAKWRERGWATLVEQLEVQVWDDGAYFEQTTWYQRYTVDFYLHAILLRESRGDAVPERTRRRVQAAVDALVQFMRPDGTTPLIGDDDGGQLCPLRVAAPNDFRPTVALAAAMFRRADWLALTQSARDVLPWLLKDDSASNAETSRSEAQPPLSRVFKNAGLVVARSAWSAEADYLLIDCGRHGSQSCGHAHADALSIEVVLRGAPICVDPGTFSYVPPARDAFRTTSAHNTLTVDGMASSVPATPFRWATVARSRVDAAITNDRFAFVEGSHDGFARLPDPAIHRRSVLAIFGRVVVIRDCLEAAGAHRLDGYYHFAPGLTAAVDLDGASIAIAGLPTANGTVVDCFVRGERVSLGVDAGEIAPSYGAALPAPVCHFTANGAGMQEVCSFFVARASDGARAELSEVRSDTSTAFVIAHDGVSDTIAVGPNGVSVGDIDSDASWAWVARDGRTGDVLEFLLVGGTRLSLRGESLASVTGRPRFVLGRRANAIWQTEAGY
jgi:hypothetical protein